MNAYGNMSGRAELNILTAQPVSERWYTIIMGHGSGRFVKNDMNGDGFMEMPLTRQYNFMNKWYYDGEDGFKQQIGIRILDDVMQGGQTHFDHGNPADQIELESSWGSEIRNKRYELFGKSGIIFKNLNLTSLGFMYSLYNHNLSSYFGPNTYSSNQSSVYLNLIYQSIIGTSEHQYKMGASLMHDRFEKSYPHGLNELPGIMRDYENSVPGIFAEYTWNPVDHFSVIAGLRADHHNRFGFFYTPRLHLRYAPFINTTLRVGGGRGSRFPNFYEENLSVLASSRQPLNTFVLTEEGFEMENAWNLGASLVQVFRLNYRRGTIVFDFFYSTFSNQLIRDMDLHQHNYMMYYLEDGSYSATTSIQVDYEPIKRLDVRLAYKYQDVKTDYMSIGTATVPLVTDHRVLINLAYETRNHWIFDLTWNWYNEKRLPTTDGSPDMFYRGEYSPAFSILHAQINKKWKTIEAYVGSENVLGFMQMMPIVSPRMPYGPYFDATIIWGPTFGRMIYAGIDFRL